MARSQTEQPKRSNTSERTPVHTDWWTGRQEAKAEDVLKLDRVRRHIESVKNLPIEKSDIKILPTNADWHVSVEE